MTTPPQGPPQGPPYGSPPSGPPPGPPQGPPPGHGGPPPVTGGSFFSKLFDFSFRTYITPSIVKVVYILTIAISVLGWLSVSLLMFNNSPVLGMLTMFIIGPLYALFIIVLVRITLEFYSAVIRIAEDVSIMRGGRM
ncbi:DUF4282 domain-containing protein [Demetria terragena]|uniref:DUF4282 domain-containing protein n=1 Tax=Demetria terragena TaxID=63959 RepID=UPI0003713DF8|nr:DUF4282 domain-containing protein [Demetria terragena]